MKILQHFVVLSFLACGCLAVLNPATNETNGVIPKVFKTDSYLDAYSNSRVDAEKSKKMVVVTPGDEKDIILDRDDSTGYDYTPQSDGSYLAIGGGLSGPGNSFTSSGGDFSSSNSYGAPVTPEPAYDSYSPPINNYGPPQNSYGPPKQINSRPPPPYPAPVVSYGPPTPVYGPSYRPALQKPTYGVPYGAPSFDFFDKISFKMDLITIAKIILKLLIFKKIVKMMAVICMLLFLPKLIEWKKGHDNNYNGQEDDSYRSFQSKLMGEDATLETAVSRALKVYQSAKSCDASITCRLNKVLDDFDERYPYSRISSAVYEVTAD